MQAFHVNWCDFDPDRVNPAEEVRVARNPPKFYFDKKPDILKNVYVWTLGRPTHGDNMISVTVILGCPCPVYWRVVILKYIYISWYLTAFIFPSTVANVPTPCQVTHTQIIT